MSTQKIHFDGILLEIPVAETIEVHSYGVGAMHAACLFFYPTMNQVVIIKYDAVVYDYCANQINGNEFHIKTIFIL